MVGKVYKGYILQYIMRKKTTSEILQKMTKDEEHRKKLKKIRQETKDFESEMNDTSKPQKRKVEIIEYDDGTFSLEGCAYSLPLQKDEVEDAFKSWLDKSLERGSIFEREDINKI